MLFDMKAFGYRLKMLRTERNLTQEQFAEIINVSVSHLGKMEIGYKAPSIEVLLMIAFFFDVTTDYLLYGRNTSSDLLKKKLKAMIAELSEFEEKM